jgi:hypothetical protein
MKTTLALLAVVGLISLTQPVLASCGSYGCAVEQPDTPALPQMPESCGGSACATPPPELKLAGCSSFLCSLPRAVSKTALLERP